MLKLYFNEREGRVGIWDTEAQDWRVEGLHCGECLEVRRGDTWVQTRIEMGQRMGYVGSVLEGNVDQVDYWYLTDRPDLEDDIEGLEVRLAA